MQIASIVVVVVGIVIGVSVTFEIARIFRGHARPYSAEINAVHGLNASHPSRNANHELRIEREKLLHRLQEIEMTLQTQNVKHTTFPSSHSNTNTISNSISNRISNSNRYNNDTSSRSRSRSRSSHEQFILGGNDVAARKREVVAEISSPRTTPPPPPPLPPPQSSSQTLPRTKETTMPSSRCPYDFKVYVYELPHNLGAVQLGEEARRNNTLHICHKCILEQFSLEYIVMDFFTQFCGRTRDPGAADFFYLPLLRDAEFRMAQIRGGTRNRAPSLTEEALIDALGMKMDRWRSVFGVIDEYWLRRKGADHILVMPAPVTNLRHEPSRRGFFHYMMHLHTPVFLCVEYSVGFVREYPTCSTQKNIVVPYPTTDPELYNGKLFAPKIKRSYLLYYAGGLHGECIEVRRGMKFLMANSTRLPGVVPPIRANQAEREHGFLAAKFCPIPVGDSPSSKRMYDVLNFGCIPVVLSDDLVWAYTRQTGGALNHSSFALHIPQSVLYFTAQHSLREYFTRRSAMGVLSSGRLVYDLLEASVNSGGEYINGQYVNPVVQILRAVTQQEIELLQAGVHRVAPFFRYYEMNSSMHRIPTAVRALPDGRALEMVAQRLSQRKAYGIEKLRDECEVERNRPNHVYEHRSTCDNSKQGSLLPQPRRRLRTRNNNRNSHSFRLRRL